MSISLLGRGLLLEQLQRDVGLVQLERELELLVLVLRDSERLLLEALRLEERATAECSDGGISGRIAFAASKSPRTTAVW